MEKIKLQLLCKNDNNNDKYYNFLKEFPNSERFRNPALNLKREDLEKWLSEREEKAKGTETDKFGIQEYLYWIILGDELIGIGLIRPHLTKEYYIRGGHIGWGLLEKYRGKGLGTVASRELINLAKKVHKVEKCLITIIDFNIASRKVAEKNGAILQKIDNHICYYEV